MVFPRDGEGGSSTHHGGSGDQDVEGAPIHKVGTQPQDSLQRTKTATKKKKSVEKASLPGKPSSQLEPYQSSHLVSLQSFPKRLLRNFEYSNQSSC